MSLIIHHSKLANSPHGMFEKYSSLQICFKLFNSTVIFYKTQRKLSQNLPACSKELKSGKLFSRKKILHSESLTCQCVEITFVIFCSRKSGRDSLDSGSAQVPITSFLLCILSLQFGRWVNKTTCLRGYLSIK